METVDASLVALRSRKRARGEILLGVVFLAIGVCTMAVAPSRRLVYWVGVSFIGQGIGLLFNGVLRHFRTRVAG
jgi:hypothetical protein